MELIYDFLCKLNIKDDDVLVVGVSFGPDSMYLLYLLKQYFKNNKIVFLSTYKSGLTIL